MLLPGYVYDHVHLLGRRATKQSNHPAMVLDTINSMKNLTLLSIIPLILLLASQPAWAQRPASEVPA